MMRLIKVMTALILSVGVMNAYSQDGQTIIPKKNQLGVTIGGNGIGVSLHYGRSFLISSTRFMEVVVGVGSVPFAGGISVPHQITYNLGKNGNYLELGLGGTYWQGTDDATANQTSISSYQIYPLVGYRKQFRNHILLKAYINPFVHISGVHLYENNDIVPFGGLSIGYSF